MNFRSVVSFACPLVFTLLVACSGGGAPGGGGSSSGKSTSSSSSGGRSSGGTTTGDSAPDAPDAPDESLSPAEPDRPSGSSGKSKKVFPCGLEDECEEGKEACQIIDGSPFACVTITVDAQCNPKRCADAQKSFGYLCSTTNFPRTTCTYPGSNPCQMTISCD